jgi:2-isopropylmalate synthase
MRKIEVLDTTLRDGAQQLGINLSVADKIQIARTLDSWGISLIEGGWPGAIPKDTEFFDTITGGTFSTENVAGTNPSKTTQPPRENFAKKLVAFGSTRKAGVSVKDDSQIAGLINSGAGTLCLVAKTDILHVTDALKTTPAENLEMISQSVSYAKNLGRRVIIDAEHFFDGFLRDSDYACATVSTAFKAGASTVCLCDTNGGKLPSDITSIIAKLRAALENDGIIISDSSDLEEDGEATISPATVQTSPENNTANPENLARETVPKNNSFTLGIHAHNDTGCAVANTVAAVEAGCAHIQGTINGYGERTGNANLMTVIPDLILKRGYDLGVLNANLCNAQAVARTIGEYANMFPKGRDPYVGDVAFAHKAGLHASAIKVNPDLYQHIDPSLVGSSMQMLISEMSGSASILLKAKEYGYDISDKPEIVKNLTNLVKQNEAKGYIYDAADASFELLLLAELGALEEYFKVNSWRAFVEQRDGVGDDTLSEATVKLTVKNSDEMIMTVGEGNGPVDALNIALTRALIDAYPQIRDFELIDYKVQITDSASGTAAVTRVLITMRSRIGETSGYREWATVGVGFNIIEASWEALVSAVNYGLAKS